MDWGLIYWYFFGYLEFYILEDVWWMILVLMIWDGDFKLMEFFEDDYFEFYNFEEDFGEIINFVE